MIQMSRATLFANYIFWHTTVWAPSWENLFLPYANNKGADQPAHPRSLISAFVVRCLDSVMSLVTVTKMSCLRLTSAAELDLVRNSRRQVFSRRGSNVLWEEQEHEGEINTIVKCCVDNVFYGWYTLLLLSTKEPSGIQESIMFLTTWIEFYELIYRHLWQVALNYSNKTYFPFKTAF